jgi:hypothetical protein
MNKKSFLIMTFLFLLMASFSCNKTNSKKSIENRPVQKKLSQQPKILKEHITDFLNNITIDK